MMPHLVKIMPPNHDALGDSPEAWLTSLPGACWIQIEGKDPSRCRVISTLLHGNEPSGFRALWRWLKRRETPCTNIVVLLPSVDAARLAPLYSHRQQPHRRDLNRCFAPPYDDPEGQLAQQVMALLTWLQPEAIIDVHNTSGHGPAFGVSVHDSPAHQALVKLFCDYLVVVDVYLGALMEANIHQAPIVTIECGGASDPLADEIAFNGIELFAHLDDLYEPQISPKLLYHPLRVELEESCWLAYGDQMKEGIDLLMPVDVDQLNFGRLEAGHGLGRLGSKGLSVFLIRDRHGEVAAEQLFHEVDGRVVASRPFYPFMITTRVDIAHSDCLFYAVPDD